MAVATLVGCAGSLVGARTASAGQLAQDTNFTAAVFGHIERSEYNIRWVEDQAVYKAANRAQNLRFTLFNDGFAVEPRDFGEGNAKPWEMTMRLQSFGKSAAFARGVESGRWTVERNAAFVDATGLTMEYTNDKDGLRQNFWVLNRPEGEGPLQLVLEVQSEALAFTVNEAENAVSFVNASGKQVARYWDLNVWDASQRSLSAKMARLDEERFAILVQDADAAYPVLIDPLYVEWGETETQSGAKFGFTVSYSGRIGQGSEPVGLVIGAPYFDTGQYANAGKVFVYFDGTVLPNNPTWTKEGDQAYGYFGWSVAGCGNVAGDAYDDIIIGAPYYDSGGYYDNGKVYVFVGSSSGLGSSPVWTAYVSQNYAHAGWSVTGIDDINSNNFDELAFGVPDYDYNGANDTGIVYVYAGGSNGPSYLNTLFGSGGSRFGFGLGGTAVWPVGNDDINGDGIADLVVGAPNWSSGGSTTGAVCVCFGSQNGFGASVTTLYGSGNGDQFGFSVAALGDTDGDGYGDVLVGAPLHDNGQSNEGKAYLFLGTSNGITTTASWTVESNQANAQMGYSVAGGPVDGEDFISDLVIGGPYYDTTTLSLTDNGQAWFYRGVYNDNPSLDAIVVGTDSYDHNGWSVAYSYRVLYRTPGIIVGAPDADGGGTVTASYWSE
ncbi:MAG: FG-GAP repeat protein [Verrucomicrobiales bacterium]|nr:FG-GAP repeat protein [Verrucomicrobiales bacterium]